MLLLRAHSFCVAPGLTLFPPHRTTVEGSIIQEEERHRWRGSSGRSKEFHTKSSVWHCQIQKKISTDHHKKNNIYLVFPCVDFRYRKAFHNSLIHTAGVSVLPIPITIVSSASLSSSNEHYQTQEWALWHRNDNEDAGWYIALIFVFVCFCHRFCHQSYLSSCNRYKHTYGYYDTIYNNEIKEQERGGQRHTRNTYSNDIFRNQRRE